MQKQLAEYISKVSQLHAATLFWLQKRANSANGMTELFYYYLSFF